MRLFCRLQVRLLWHGLLKWRATGLSESLRLTKLNLSLHRLPARFTDVEH